MPSCRVLKLRVVKGWRGLEILAPKSASCDIRPRTMLKCDPAGGPHLPPALDAEGTVHSVEHLGRLGGPVGGGPRDPQGSWAE